MIQTPAFMPVGTQGAVKAVLPRDLVDLGAEIMLSNTYHLYLRPGDGLIARLGGLHRFIGWDRPILTDSGGYQAFSLGERRTIDEQGICFRSHLDGSTHLLTPEKATDIQANLGSDIAMVLDECLGYPATRDQAAASMERTLRWEARCRTAVRGVAGTGLRPQASGLGPGRRYTHQPRPGAVRHRSGRDVQRYTCRQRPGHGRPRLRGLRHRRPQCRGTARIDVRDCRRNHPAPAGRPAPLPDGNRDAGGPGRIGGPRASTCSTA